VFTQKLFAELSLPALNADVRFCRLFLLSQAARILQLLHKTAPNQRGFFLKEAPARFGAMSALSP
jgi:hypothetical protein